MFINCVTVFHQTKTLLDLFSELTRFENRSSTAFITAGFCDWNDPRRKLDTHSKSISHQESMLALSRYTVKPVDEILNKNSVSLKEDNSQTLLSVIKVVRHLARQNLALRGATKKDEDHCEPDSNLWQTLQLLASNDSHLQTSLRKKQNFTSPVIQNEILQLMANDVLRRISLNVRDALFFSIMVDETRDVANLEQVVLCVR